MRKLITNPVAVAITLILGGFFYYIVDHLFDIDPNPSSISHDIHLPSGDTSFGGIFYEPYVDDSLPFYQHKRITDSFKLIKDEIEHRNRCASSGMTLGAIGFANIIEKKMFAVSKVTDRDALMIAQMDSIDALINLSKSLNLADSNEIKKIQKLASEISQRYRERTRKISDSINNFSEKSYYFTLSGYETDMSNHFFIQNGTYNLAYPVYDSLVKRAHGSSYVGHYERIQIPIRYSKEDKRVLIPVSKSNYRIIAAAISIGTWLILALHLFFVLGLPLQMLISISRGKAFTESNIFRLRAIALFLVLYGCIKTFLPNLLRVFFGNMIPHELTLASISASFFNDFIYYFLAAVVFVISLAFKKGFQLQHEQNLTI
jgi:hypothetical protein